MILKILAAVFTGIGGHYLNRRWDKAILFLCLFICYMLATYILLTFYLFSLKDVSGSSDEVMMEISDISQLISTAYSAGIFFLWMISLVITVMDSKNNVEPNIIRWTSSGIAGAFITSVLTFIILVFTVLTSSVMSNNQVLYSGSGSSDSEISIFSSHNFYEYLYLGGSPSDTFNLPAPPKGEGVLRGKMAYQGDPAVGVAMDIILNSQYKVEDVVTDEHGVFSVSLPSGIWIINSIQTKSWANKPKDGEYTIYYGGEEKLSGNNYSRHSYYKKDGYSVNVSAELNVIHFNALISNDIELIWPNLRAERIDSTMDDSISWKKYPNASRYYIEIKQLTREGDTTHYEQVTSRVLLDKTTLPLSSLKNVKTEGEEKVEYAAEIYAFSDDGTLIAEFSDTYQGGTFLLPDGVVLVENRLDALFDLSSLKDPGDYMKKMEAISLNERRKKAVSVLIDDNMLQAAQLLVNLMESEYSKGNKEVLAGYILALQGECDKSSDMFKQASLINPNICIADKYKGSCK